MEINIDNAFILFVRISLKPFLTTIDAVSQGAQKRCHQFLVAMLKRPLLATMLLTSLMVMCLSIITMSIIVLVAVFCIVMVIIIFEGFILGVILILTAVIVISSVGLLFLVLGLKSTYSTND